MKIIKYDDIKTPKTVEEFRENLKKYFVCFGKDWSNRNALLYQGDLHGIVYIDELNSLSDLYNYEISKPMITPYIDFDVNSISGAEIMKNMFSRNFEDVMKDESRFKVLDIDSNKSNLEFFEKFEPMWYSIDNQILREFYIKTLGDFSGYSKYELEEVA